ncbi:MAG: hypothetical protein E1N59_1594 [Puniceicoccaceae bacterium 5H]|nr:MAG: hypothetical protein E1N59_1594 [Puniceicoccaceae bacterium 5H]
MKLRRFFCLFLSVACLGGIAQAQDDAASLQEVAQRREAQLADALERLRTLRNDIEAQQIPLAQRLQDLDAQIRERQREVERRQRIRDNQSVELDTLRQRVSDRQRELDYISRTLLPEYFANYDASLSAGERATAGEDVRQYNLFLEKPDTSETDRLQHSLALLRDSWAQLESRLGGKRYAGEALDPEGRVISGRFVQTGPLLYFAADQGELAGLAEETTALNATVTPLSTSQNAHIVEVAQAGRGTLPVDPSLGNALAIEQTRDSLTEHLEKGGIWVYPILLFALAATLVAILKIFQVYRIRHPQPMAIHDIVKALRAGQRDEAMRLARSQPEPAREMLVAAVEHSDESVEMVEEVMYESMLSTQPRLERFLNVIAVTASAAPLLGLLGTVTGIIKTFRLMTVFGAGDPKPLISGISEALITTELGLVLAIPALVLHAMLSRKVAGVMARLEKASVAFLNGLSRKSLNQKAS